jgi:hypothetical protein
MIPEVSVLTECASERNAVRGPCPKGAKRYVKL